MKFRTLSLLPLLLTTAAASAADCHDVAKALKLDGALGSHAAYEIEDTATGEIVRLFLVKTDETTKPYHRIQLMAMSVGNVDASGKMTYEPTGTLARELDARSNIGFGLYPQLGWTDCQMDFAERRYGPKSTSVGRFVTGISRDVVAIQAKDPSSIPNEIVNALKIRYYGATIN